jgi:quercetin dioxygenase-like cupin family protein
VNRDPRGTIIKETTLERWVDIPEELLNPDISRKMIVGQNEMLARLALKKGSVVPAHRHVSEQISSVLSGALVFKMDRKEITVREGEVLVIPPDVVHSVVALEDTVAVDAFSPIRTDWLSGDDSYLRTGKSQLPETRRPAGTGRAPIGAATSP